jgi:hypothetical protein
MARSIEDILMPGGKPIGVKGTGKRASAKIREMPTIDTNVVDFTGEAIPVEKIKFA